MKETENGKKLFDLIANLLNLDPDRINDETSPSNTSTWDSYTGLMMVTEIESAFNVSFSMAEVVAVRDVSDIRECLAKHGVAF